MSQVVHVESLGLLPLGPPARLERDTLARRPVEVAAEARPDAPLNVGDEVRLPPLSQDVVRPGRDVTLSSTHEALVAKTGPTRPVGEGLRTDPPPRPLPTESVQLDVSSGTPFQGPPVGRRRRTGDAPGGRRGPTPPADALVARPLLHTGRVGVAEVQNSQEFVLRLARRPSTPRRPRPLVGGLPRLTPGDPPVVLRVRRARRALDRAGPVRGGLPPSPTPGLTRGPVSLRLRVRAEGETVQDGEGQPEGLVDVRRQAPHGLPLARLMSPLAVRPGADAP